MEEKIEIGTIKRGFDEGYGKGYDKGLVEGENKQIQGLKEQNQKLIELMENQGKLVRLLLWQKSEEGII
jgi:flagellar biosynthesis/type III secretory pathway protein FliH